MQRAISQQLMTHVPYQQPAQVIQRYIGTHWSTIDLEAYIKPQRMIIQIPTYFELAEVNPAYSRIIHDNNFARSHRHILKSTPILHPIPGSNTIILYV